MICLYPYYQNTLQVLILMLLEIWANPISISPTLTEISKVSSGLLYVSLPWETSAMGHTTWAAGVWVLYRYHYFLRSSYLTMDPRLSTEIRPLHNLIALPRILQKSYKKHVFVRIVSQQSCMKSINGYDQVSRRIETPLNPKII